MTRSAMLKSYTFPNIHPVLIPERAESDIQPDWIHAVNPDHEECCLLAQRYAVPLEYIQAALDDNERPRLEHTENCLLLLTRVPIDDPKNTDVFLITCPVAVIITESVAITVCIRENVVESMMASGLKGNRQRRQVQLALTLLFRTSSLFIESLRHMNQVMSTFEKTLHQSMQNSELINMLHIEKALIFSYTAIRGNHTTIEKFATYPLIRLTLDEKELLDDVLIENKQASDMADVITQVIGSMSDAFGAIVSNNLNKVMKLLTGLTLIFRIPSTLGAIYGMNVPLPLQTSPHAFILICGMGVGITGVLTWLFWKNRWL